MRREVNILIKRYAQAFLEVFTPTSIDAIQNAASYLHKYKYLGVLFKLPAIDPKAKENAIHTLCAQFQLPKGLEKLMRLMLKQKRAHLFAHVFDEICNQYRLRQGMMVFSIISSHELSEHDVDVLKSFLAQSTGKDIIYTYTTDKKLIAGIRLQSKTLFWEHSIRKQLQEVRRQLIR